MNNEKLNQLRIELEKTIRSINKTIQDVENVDVQPMEHTIQALYRKVDENGSIDDFADLVDEALAHAAEASEEAANAETKLEDVKKMIDHYNFKGGEVQDLINDIDHQKDALSESFEETFQALQKLSTDVQSIHRQVEEALAEISLDTFKEQVKRFLNESIRSYGLSVVEVHPPVEVVVVAEEEETPEPRVIDPHVILVTDWKFQALDTFHKKDLAELIRIRDFYYQLASTGGNEKILGAFTFVGSLVDELEQQMAARTPGI